MKKLDISKMTSIDSNEAIQRYQEELLKKYHENILLSVQNEKLQAIIEYVSKNNIDSLPKEYLKEINYGINNK